MCGCKEPSGAAAPGATAVATTVSPIVDPAVPLAGPIPLGDGGLGDGGEPDEPDALPIPTQGVTSCLKVLREGCYTITFRPTNSFVVFEGTVRVDRSAPDGGPDNIIVSGDLYRRRMIVLPPVPTSGTDVSVAATASSPDADPVDLTPNPIPIFPRARYHSYLKVISMTGPALVPKPRHCPVTAVLEQYDYTQPAAGSFKGSFPATPSRTVTLSLTADAPLPVGNPSFTGRWSEAGVDRGAVAVRWVSPFFRRATVEMDTLTGAIAPLPVGSEFFDTIYAKHGWQLKVITDQTGIAVPAGVNPTDCWQAGELHNLMTANRDPATNLDAEWRVHLIVVPAKLGCGRGVMYDQIGVPREGCASFSDDGYPSGDSSNFGVAVDKKQRDIPRAFLRSATHEITHTFNQIHQEQETTADNSIMTTTPSVADVLGGPTTGAPGVFPDQINLAVNTTVRHHLNHMPDPVIRPGGWPFASWFGTSVPQATDRHDFAPSEVELVVSGPAASVVLGEPFELSWTMTNRTDDSLIVPNDVTLEGQFASMTITDAAGTARDFRPFVILCDRVRLAELESGGSVSASHRVFWSSGGFAFPRPGRYRVDVAVTWSARGVPVRLAGTTDVYVDYPTTATDNDAAGLMLNAEVGKWVALGGNAYHLTEATRRLTELAAAQDSDGGGPRLLAGLSGLLPDADRVRAAESDGGDPPQSSRSRRR